METGATILKSNGRVKAVYWKVGKLYTIKSAVGSTVSTLFGQSFMMKTNIRAQLSQQAFQSSTH
jgi:hypothetical protein